MGLPPEGSPEESQGRRWGQHHVHETPAQRAVRGAVSQVGVAKRAGCHPFRHASATQLFEAGYDVRIIQELLGHKDVRTTMIYTHVLNRGGGGVRSPLGDRRPRLVQSAHFTFGGANTCRLLLLDGVP